MNGPRGQLHDIKKRLIFHRQTLHPKQSAAEFRLNVSDQAQTRTFGRLFFFLNLFCVQIFKLIFYTTRQERGSSLKYLFLSYFLIAFEWRWVKVMHLLALRLLYMSVVMQARYARKPQILALGVLVICFENTRLEI